MKKDRPGAEKKAKVFISTSSFGVYDVSPLEELRQAGFEVELNPFGRKMTEEEAATSFNNIDYLIAGTEPITGRVIQACPELRIISRCGTGTGNIDMEAAGRKGIRIFNTPDGPTEAVAELTVGLMLDLLRNISLSDRNMRSGKWEKNMGGLLKGRKVGIIGFGRIGRRVASILGGFGAELLYFDPGVPDGRGAAKAGSFEEILAGSDLLTIHIPHRPGEKSLITAKEISLMKKNALIVNTSRGGVVEEKALVEAIKNGRIAGAAVDVYDKEPYCGPLSELEKVVLTPHIGSYARESRIKMERQAVMNLISNAEAGDLPETGKDKKI